jgi:hypothetical protein
MKRWIEPYWEQKGEKYPGLNVKVALPPSPLNPFPNFLQRLVQNADPKYMNYEEIEAVYGPNLAYDDVTDSLITFEEMRGKYPGNELNEMDQQMEGMVIDGEEDEGDYYEDGDDNGKGDYDENGNLYDDYDEGYDENYEYDEEENKEDKKDEDGDVEMGS